MRSESFTTISGLTLINQCHGNDPRALIGAIHRLADEARERSRVVILDESPDQEARNHEGFDPVFRELIKARVDYLIIIGANTSPLAHSAIKEGMDPQSVLNPPNGKAAAQALRGMADKGTFILYSSPEKRPLEEVASLFVGSLGRTRLYVDLDSMGENIRAFNSKTQPGVEIMAVVKSFGYGHDSVAASRIALENNVKYLAVAIPDEGVFLRENHINAPILVFNVCASSDTAKLLDYDLAATVTSFDMAKTLDRAASKDRKIKAHLKIDTGMGRSGVWFEDAIDFVKDCMSLGNLDMEGIMTHLSSADDPGEDCFTMEQIKAFQRLVDELKSMGVSFKFVHAANTAAIARFPRSHFNMVRPGLGVYGMYPSDAVREEIDLKPVITFTTHISQIKEHPPGRSISYGRRYITDKPSRIATLPVGYNDGYPRFQSNRGRVLIRGKEAPVRGTVCMDAIMADITAIPEAQIGDEAVLIGRQGAKEISVDEIADNGGTINYEITCKISPRVQRIFLKS